MSYKPAYIRPYVPPPTIPKGTRNIATIKSITQTKSGYGHLQWEFALSLDEHPDFDFKDWVRHYDLPSERSHLAILATTVCEHLRRTFGSVEETLSGLLAFGKVYVDCTGVRVVKDITYPAFDLVFDQLPTVVKQEGLIPPVTVPVAPTVTIPVETPTVIVPVETPVKADKAEEIIKFILENKPSFNRKVVEGIVAEEVAGAAGVLTREAAAFVTARNLGLDFETSGTQIM
ncbi:hypothetical protein ES702_05334 [subsurface metagenome]